MATPEELIRLRQQLNNANRNLELQQARNAANKVPQSPPPSFQEISQLQLQRKAQEIQKAQDAINQTNAKRAYENSPQGQAEQAKANAAEAAKLQDALLRQQAELDRITPAKENAPKVNVEPPPSTVKSAPPSTGGSVASAPVAKGPFGGAGGAVVETATGVGIGIGTAVGAGGAGVEAGAEVGSPAGPVGIIVGAIAVGAIAFGLALLQQNNNKKLTGDGSSSSNLSSALGGLYSADNNQKINDNPRGFEGGQVPDAQYLVHYEFRNWDNWISATEASSHAASNDEIFQAKGPIGQFTFEEAGTDHYGSWNGDVKYYRAYFTSGNGTQYWGNSWELGQGDFIRVIKVERLDGSSPEHDKIQSDLYTSKPTNDQNFVPTESYNYKLNLGGLGNSKPQNNYYPPATTFPPSYDPKRQTEPPNPNPKTGKPVLFAPGIIAPDNFNLDIAIRNEM